MRQTDPLWIKAEEAFVPLFKAYIEKYKERILKNNSPDRPLWDLLSSTQYAKDTFHDMVVETIWDGIVKGRQWE